MASISGADQLVMNLGSFVMEKVALIDAPGVERIVKAVANLYVSYAAGIDSIASGQNTENESNEALPPVVPRQLAALSYSGFCSIVRTHQERLVATGWSATCLDVMEQEHQDLVRYFAGKPSLYAALSSFNNNVSFDAGWSVVKGLFESMKLCFGGIPYVFLGTAQVESDFILSISIRTTSKFPSLTYFSRALFVSISMPCQPRSRPLYANTTRPEVDPY